MTTYRFSFHKRGRVFLASKSADQKARILESIHKLPHTGDVKKLSNSKNTYRLRVGDIRVVFTVDSENKVVYVEDIGNRGDVYK